MSALLPNLLSVRRTFRLRPEEDTELVNEAQKHGYGLSSFIRIKLLDRTRGLCIRTQPTLDMGALYEASSAIYGLMDVLQRVEAVLGDIAQGLSRNSRDLFGLDGCLRELKQTIADARLTLSAIDTALIARRYFPDINSSDVTGQEGGK